MRSSATPNSDYPTETSCASTRSSGRKMRCTPARRVDIGIVPSLLPVAGGLATLRRTAFDDPRLAYEPFDHLVRFKASTNAGRIYPFARLQLPVIADFTPSNAQFIRDGETGFLAAGRHGWYEALALLAEDAVLRERLGKALGEAFDRHYDAQVDALLTALRRPVLGPPPALGERPTPDERLNAFAKYPSPSQRRRRGRRGARSEAAVRVYVNFTEHRGPYGGANSFLRSLTQALRKRGVEIVLDEREDADLALLNALTEDIDLAFVERIARRDIPIVHRKVGYRASGSQELRAEVDGVIVGNRHQIEFTPYLVHTIFQSEYSRNEFESMGFNGPSTIIPNGVDELVFSP